MAHRLYRCYAKINLTLEILGRRADGYHDLASLVHTISLADRLSIGSAATLSSQVEGLEIDPTTNLVTNAARLVAEARPGLEAGAELMLVKQIPAAAGLGGGSSDAATTLVGLNALWSAGLKPADLHALAGRLGSDVPYFLRGGAAVLRGRGADLETLPPVTDQWLVLTVPPHDIADKTRRLYGALEPADFSSGASTERAAARLRAGQDKAHTPSWTALSDQDLVNGFARAARTVFPSLSATWAEVERLCQRPFHLSGAGPSLFALCVDRAEAVALRDMLLGVGQRAYAARTVKQARAQIKLASDLSIGYP